MSLKYLTERALATLKLESERNPDRYKDPHQFPCEAVLGTDWCREAATDHGVAPKLSGTEPGDDFENTKRLFTAFNNLTPVQAADQRLWVYLAHVEYWEYMVGRWGNDNVRARFFFKSGGITGLALHGIARLWWFGKLTFDPKRADPWELTRTLLLYQDIQQGLFQRNFGRAETVRHAALEFFATQHERLERISKKTKVIGAMWTDLNLAGGATLLDSTPKAMLLELLDRSLTLNAARLEGDAAK